MFKEDRRDVRFLPLLRWSLWNKLLYAVHKSIQWKVANCESLVENFWANGTFVFDRCGWKLRRKVSWIPEVKLKVPMALWLGTNVLLLRIINTGSLLLIMGRKNKVSKCVHLPCKHDRQRKLLTEGHHTVRVLEWWVLLGNNGVMC